MSFASLAIAIQDTEFFTALRESGLAYPIILSTHLASIALFGGLIVMTDLRLLGLAMTGTPVSEVVEQLRAWKRLGFVIMVACGILLFGAKAGSYYDNPYFQMKITLLLLVGVHALFFRRSVYANPALDRTRVMPGNAKLAACLSLVLWVGILSCGRWIAYFEKPQAKTVRTSHTYGAKPAAPHFDADNPARRQS